MADSPGSANTSRQLQQGQSAYSISRSYSPPSMQPTYTYSPLAGPGADQYRAPQPESHASPLPAINLPPIRSIDAQAQASMAQVGAVQYQPQFAQQASPVLQQPPLPQYPLPGPMPSFYPHQPSAPAGMHHHSGHQLGYGAPVPPATALYRLPPQVSDQRVMSGGRHKKEIKRRTKTGCLTCRKRRIKCDEAHPTCRNCQKSKRECLGYDPIFKQQSSPPPLHPAPNPTPNAEPSSTAVRKRTSEWTAAPISYATTAERSYSRPSSGDQAPHSYDYKPAVDPSLGPRESMMHSLPAQADPIDVRDDRRRSVYDAAFPRKRARLDDLFCIGGHAPPLPHIPPATLTQANVDEVRLIFTRDFAPGLDRLLETEWFSKRSWPVLLQDHRLLSLFDQMLERCRMTRSDDFNGTQLIRSMETIVAWELLSLVRSPQSAPSESGSGPALEETYRLREAQARLDALEALLTNATLARNPMQDLRYDYQLQHPKQLELEFWRLLGQFVAPIPPATPADALTQPTTEETLQGCRGVLAMLENRDVLYSVMICRYFGPQLPGWPDISSETSSNNPEDARNKVLIARKFIEDEAAGKGTSQVIQRICDMAIRAWHVTR